MDAQTLDLARECIRQYRNCLYTGASLYNWLRVARYMKIAFVVVLIILAGVASWNIFSETAGKFWFVIFAGAAGLIPAIYEALKMDDHLGSVKTLAGEFTNLRCRFRQAALVTALKPYPEFETEFHRLMERMERAREEGITAPARYFRKAQ